MRSDETDSYLLQQLKEVKAWEKDQKKLWFWERLGRLPFALLDKVTPRFVQNKIGQALDELGRYIQSGGRYLINEEAILKKFPNQDTDSFTIEDAANCPLQTMDEMAGRLTRSRKKVATVQGATTGVGGVFTLALDVPALLGLSLKILQEIAICYGYDPKEKEERVFIVKCLQFSASDIVGKRAILKEFSNFQHDNNNGLRKKETVSQLQSWREVITTYRDNFGWKKLFQLVPVAGIIFGAFINKSTIEEVAEAGTMLYRKRRIIEKLKAD